MLYIIVNEKSRTGKGAGVWGRIEAVLKDEAIEYQAFTTEYEGHAAELAGQITSREEAEVSLVVVGGDGTINEVLNGIRDFDRMRLGIIPTGSGNDFGRGVGLCKDPEENLRRILACMGSETGYVHMDLGQVSWNGCSKPRLFGISAGVGLDAIVCKKALHSKLKTVLNKIRMGNLTYIFLTVETLFSMKTADLRSSFDGNPVKEQRKMIFAAAMNLRAEGGGVPMAPKASPFDGKLSVCSACGIPKWRTFFCLPLLVTAHHEHIRGFEVMDGSNIHIHLSEPMVLHADGEYCGEVTDVTFTCLPGKLRLMK